MVEAHRVHGALPKERGDQEDAPGASYVVILCVRWLYATENNV